MFTLFSVWSSQMSHNNERITYANVKALENAISQSGFRSNVKWIESIA